MSVERLRGLAAGCSKLDSIRGRYTNTKIQSEALADKKGAYKPRRSAKVGPACLLRDPKCSNALPLRLRAACVPHPLHQTDEFDAPSVHKGTQSGSTKVQPPQGSGVLHKIETGSNSGDNGYAWWASAWSKLAAGGNIVQTGVQKQEVCSMAPSEVDSVHGRESFPFLHGGRVF